MATSSDNNKKMLIIVESPTKAKTIKKFLPSHCVVVASFGHVRDLPAKEIAIDVDHDYKAKYVIPSDKKKVIETIKSELVTSDSLMLATDEDREGESISWHLLEVLKPKIPYRRMVFHEITKKAILHALDSGRELDMSLVNAQEARRILDRLYGYTLSPLLWKKLSQQSLSAGRVQSPGLRLIVERERQRLSFVKSEYWDIAAKLSNKTNGNNTFIAKLESVGNKKVASGKDFDSTTGTLLPKRNVLLFDEQEATQLAERLKTARWTIADVQAKEKKQRPAPPFITSTLQQEANRKLRLGAKDTMKIAQRLYESGLITYMRTDSPTLSQEGIRAARDAAGSLYGMEYLSPTSRQYASSSASAQEAHEAIRPAGDSFVHPGETNLKGKELALYEMIWKRTLASQMADAIKAITTVHVKADDAMFVATGNRIVYPGFIKVYVESHDDADEAAEDEESFLPALKAQDELALYSLESVQHETKQPARYTEATLVQELEKLGIGRPSTYAAIIDKLLDKAYVIKEGNSLIPTFTAFGVVQLLEHYFSDYVDYDFTSNMEQELDEIAVGKLDRVKFLKAFYEGETGLRQKLDLMMKKIKGPEAKRLELPHLTTTTVLLGKFGPYISVSSPEDPEKDINITVPEHLYPGIMDEDKIQELIRHKQSPNNGPQLLGTDPATGLDVFLCKGKFGPYYCLGEKSADNPVPKKASVPKGYSQDDLSFDKVLWLLHLPRTLGKHPKTGEPVNAGIGKFGPYVACDGEFRSLPNLEMLHSITFEEALKVLAEPKAGKKGLGKAKTEQGAVIEFGEHEGQPLGIHFGRYGYYGKWGKKNFTFPPAYKKDKEKVLQLTKDQVIEFLNTSKNK